MRLNFFKKKKRWINLFGKRSFNIVYYVVHLNIVYHPAYGYCLLLLVVVIQEQGTKKGENNLENMQLSKGTSLNTFKVVDRLGGGRVLQLLMRLTPFKISQTQC